MTLPAISTVINPPLVSDTPEQFNTKAFDSWLKLSLLSPELNTWSIAADALGASVSSNKSAVDLKAAEASTSAINAAGSASSANSSKIEAAQSASNALTSANNAESSAVQASKLNLGAKNTPPALDNQGQPLLTGAVYYDTVQAKWKVWNGSTWVNGVTAGVTSVNGKIGDAVITKPDIGLGNVDDTSDANKPVSTAQQAALNTKLDKTGGNISGSLLVTGGGLGYGVGAGGVVVQPTDKITAVTLNKPCGQITTHNQAMSPGASVYFECFNNTVVTGDLAIIEVPGGGDPVKYTVRALVGNGVIGVLVRNISSDNLSDSLIIRFIIIKGNLL